MEVHSENHELMRAGEKLAPSCIILPPFNRGSGGSKCVGCDYGVDDRPRGGGDGFLWQQHKSSAVNFGEDEATF